LPQALRGRFRIVLKRLPDQLGGLQLVGSEHVDQFEQLQPLAQWAGRSGIEHGDQAGAQPSLASRAEIESLV
jgi:hypothetical protein